MFGQTRPGAQEPQTTSIEWLDIDLHDTQALVHAAQGATVVVHALNPAYTNKAWQTQVLPMTEASLAIARALGATLMVPGNVYNFGHAMPAVLREAEARQRLLAGGWDPQGSSAEGLAARVKEEARILGDIITSRGIKLE